MKPEEFCYWLQGFLELSKTKTITVEQIKCIQKHLDLVFVKVTGPDAAKKLQEELEKMRKAKGGVYDLDRPISFC
jgi:hypothetical protein